MLLLYSDEWASLFTCLPRQHLELILVLMDFQTFSFSLADWMGKRLNTSTFNAGSFVTSSCCLLWVLLVYAVAQLFQDNEERQKFKSTPKPLFPIYKMSPTPLDLLGITNDWMTSSLTLLSLKLDDWSVGVCRCKQFLAWTCSPFLRQCYIGMFSLHVWDFMGLRFPCMAYLSMRPKITGNHQVR